MRRKSLSVIMFTVLICIPTLLAVLCLGGCSNASGEYKEAAANICRSTEATMEEGLDAMDEAESSLDMAMTNADEFALQTRDILAESRTAVEEDLEELEGLNPPEDAASLHQEIIQTYQDDIDTYTLAESVMDDLAQIFQPFSDGLDAALNFDLTSQTTAQDIEALQGTLQAYLDQLRGLTLSSGSEEIQQFQAECISYLEHELATYETLKQLLRSWSQALEDQYTAQLDQAMQLMETLGNSIFNALDALEDEVNDMPEGIEELINKIEAL